ncbi:HAD family hydrolase [Pokkaliibacter sp. CJK22405]|uniref:HAD family hydrolase n=1 Tax=Pokkaliibacter sp. CJK22405 TaxID=3384615 RepID=UPI0039856899
MTTHTPVPAKNPHLDWICFDLDDTLWETDSVILRANQAMFDYLHAQVPGAKESLTASDWTPLRDQALTRTPELAASVSALRLEVLRAALESLGHGGDDLNRWQQEAFLEFRHWRNQVTLFEGVLPMLAALREQGYRLGVFSNGNADLQAIGLAHHFDVVMSADEIGAAKPAAEAFEALRQACNVPMARIAYVGDHPRYDVEGANAAGMVSVWANYHRREWQWQGQPDVELVHLPALPAQLADFQAG